MSQAMRVTSQLPPVRPGGFPADPDFPQLAIASDPHNSLWALGLLVASLPIFFLVRTRG